MAGSILPDLAPWQISALKRYAADFERARRPSFKRIEAEQALRAARAALPETQFAVIDLIAGRGKSVADLATLSGRKPMDLHNLLSRGASNLARHYEAQTASGEE